MSNSTFRFTLRHSGSHANSSNKLNKVSPLLERTLALKRMNTQNNEKSSNKSRKYLLRRGAKYVDNRGASLSKQNINPNRASDMWNRISFNQFELEYPKQDINKKPALKKNGYISKVQQLDKLIRKKNQRKTNQTELSISSLNKKEKTLRKLNCTDMMVRKEKQGKLTQNQHSEVECENKKYEILNNKIIGAGTFGKVYVAINHQNKQKYAIKKVYNDKAFKCREVELMMKVDSHFVIKMLDQFTTHEACQHHQQNQKQKQKQKQFINIVMPKFQSSLFDFLKPIKYKISQNLMKIYLYQIFRGVMHLHSRGICHRDLKPQNILIKQNRLVICDLGSAKILKKQQPNISYICSRCYRAPQLIFGSTNYTISIDMWSVGCIILEILNKGPFFIAKDSLHHLIQIMKIMGTPSKRQIMAMNPQYDISNYDLPIIKKTNWSDIFVGVDNTLLDLISKILVYNPHSRLSAERALCHPYFDDIRDKQFLNEMSQQVEFSNFFQFDEQEVSLMQKPYTLIPKWYIE